MAVSSYGASVVLQNNSASAAASAAPTGSVFLFASGAVGSAKLYMNKEGSQDVFEVNADLKFAGDSGTGTVGLGAGQTFTIAGGTGLDTSASGQTLTFSMDLNELSAAAVDVSADSIAIVDANDSNASKKESIADLMTAVAGNGLAASSGVLAVGVDDTGIEINSDALRLKDNGVTLAKMAGITRGSIILGDASGDPSLLAKGTAAQFLQSDGTDPSYVSISGDATVAAGGALTIAADAVEGSMLNDNVISGQTELAHADIASADELMISDGGTLKKVGLDSLRDHYYGQVSGDATIADGGALTIGANAVQTGMVHDDVATELAGDGLSASGGVMALDLNELTAAAVAVGADSIAIIDADDNTSKKEAIADLATAMAGDGLAASSGVFAVGVDDSSIETNSDALRVKALGITNAMLAADAVDGAKLADDAVNSEHIALGALDSEHYASGSIQTGHVADNQVTLAKMAGLASAKFILGNSDGDPAAVTMSGDATLSNTGALTIAAAAIEHGMLAEDIISGQAALGGASVAQADLLMLDDGPGAVKKVTFSNFEDSIFGNVSGDATVAAGGALTIANDAVESGMLNDNVISGQTELAHADIASADELMISDGGTLKKVGLDSLRDHYYGQVSGDATIADGGALTIAAQAVENSMLADDAVGADELAANAVVNDSVASNAAIVATKLNFNVDLGGNVQFGTQSDDTVAFGGPIKVGGNAIADSGGNSVISFDGSGNGGFGANMTVGGGYGSSGVTITSAGAINADGALTVGADGAGVNFAVYGAAANERMLYDAGNHVLQFRNSSGATMLNLGGDATTEYALDIANGANNINKVRAAAFVTYSDESLKSDVKSMNTALDTVMSLEGVEFTWKDSGERDFGFIAQDVQSVLPKAVHVAEDGVQGVDYSRLTSVLVEAVKAQQVQIEELKALLKK
jgi:hypothetical protein